MSEEGQIVDAPSLSLDDFSSLLNIDPAATEENLSTPFESSPRNIALLV